MKRKKRVKLSKDDIYLFDYLFRHRVASGKMIYRDIFNKYKNSEVARIRLSRLRKAGYIRGKYFSSASRDMCYGLTSAIAKEFINSSMTAYIWKGTNSPGHDIDLIDIWKSLRKRSMISYILTEHEYNVRDGSKTEGVRMLLGELRPDGYVEIEMGENKFIAALEYERSPKTKARYFEMIDRYYRNKEIKAVLYVSDKEHVDKLVKKTELEYRTRSQEPKFFYALKRDITNSETIHFSSVGKNEYSIEMKYSDTDSDTKVTDSVSNATMQSLENIRETILTKNFGQNPSTPMCTDFNTKNQITKNETGGQYGH